MLKLFVKPEATKGDQKLHIDAVTKSFVVGGYLGYEVLAYVIFEKVIYEVMLEVG